MQELYTKLNNILDTNHNLLNRFHKEICPDEMQKLINDLSSVHLIPLSNAGMDINVLDGPLRLQLRGRGEKLDGSCGKGYGGSHKIDALTPRRLGDGRPIYSSSPAPKTLRPKLREVRQSAFSARIRWWW